MMLPSNRRDMDSSGTPLVSGTLCRIGQFTADGMSKREGLPEDRVDCHDDAADAED